MTIKRYTNQRSGYWLLILIALGLLLPAPPFSAHAQTPQADQHTLVVRGVPMSEALEQLVRLTRIDLVYNADLVAGKHVYCARYDVPSDALLQCLLVGSGLDYVRSSSGAYVLIDALQQPPRFGDLAGIVVDEATGEPLPYANVLLADASAGTTTNEAGLFTMSSLLSGRHRLMVTYVGYETVVDSIWINPGAHEHLRVGMEAQALEMEPVVVNGLTQRLPSYSLGNGSLEGRHLTASASGGTPDVARSAATLTGVSTQHPLADLHIQGSASGEHLTLLDGAAVRDPVSLGRHLGAFSPLALSRLTVHKAGFGAEWGSHLAGVVAVEHAVSGADSGNIVMSIDPVSFNGKAQSAFRLGSSVPGAVMVALRTSLWDVYQDPGLNSLLYHWNAIDPTLASLWLQEPVSTQTLGLHQHTPALSFSDLHVAARLNPGPYRVLHASFYRARNRIDSDFTTLNTTNASTPDRPLVDRLVVTRDDYDWTNWAAQVRHSWLLGARSVASVQALGSWHASRYLYAWRQHEVYQPVETRPQLEEAAATLWAEDYPLQGADEQNTVRELALRARLSHSFSPHRQVEVGLSAQHTESRFRLGNQFLTPFRSDAAAWDLAAYATSRLALGLRTTLEPGLRLTLLPARQTVYAEPRLALRYDREASRIGAYALRLSGGLYRQFTNQFDLSSTGSTSVVPYVLFWLPVDQTLAPPRAYHAAADALLMPAPRWTIHLESYFKAQPRLLTVDYVALLADSLFEPFSTAEPPGLAQADFIQAVRGRAYGGSIRVRRTGAFASQTISYGFSRAVQTFPDRFDGRLVPVPWNEPHRLAVDMELALNDHWKASVNWLGAWGRRWALRRAYYDYLPFRYPYLSLAPLNLNRPDDHHLPAYHRVDVGASYGQSWGRVALQLRLAVINVFDRQNVYDWSLESTDTGMTLRPRLLPGRHLAASLRVGY